MKRSEHRRTKRGKVPGDLEISVTARMQHRLEEFSSWSGQYFSLDAVRHWRRFIKEQGHAVQRQRDKAMITEGLSDGD